MGAGKNCCHGITTGLPVSYKSKFGCNWRWIVPDMAVSVALVCLLVVFVITICCDHFTESTKPPHILFMLADDLGWYDVGYHNPKIQTPNIDKLAKEGVTLDQYYVQQVCTPTRGALMTGRYPIHTGYSPKHNLNESTVIFLAICDSPVKRNICGATRIWLFSKDF